MPGTVDWFISHFWALPFQDFAQSLRAHAMYVGRDWEAIKYWMLGAKLATGLMGSVIRIWGVCAIVF